MIIEYLDRATHLVPTHAQHRALMAIHCFSNSLPITAHFVYPNLRRHMNEIQRFSAPETNKEIYARCCPNCPPRDNPVQERTQATRSSRREGPRPRCPFPRERRGQQPSTRTKYRRMTLLWLHCANAKSTRSERGNGDSTCGGNEENARGRKREPAAPVMYSSPSVVWGRLA